LARGDAHKRRAGPDAAQNLASILFEAVADKRAKQKSKYTLDRGMPGAFEGETITRRRFMVGGANVAGAVAAGAFTLPALGFAIGPIFKSNPHRWVAAGPVGDFPDNNYVPVVITLTPGIGEAGKTTVYVRKFNPEIDTDPYDRNTPYIAISSRCAHVGCPVRWVDASERFICPCHGGVYDLLGRRVGGPPVRPLDRFYTRVVGQQVQIGSRFSVNSELRRFSPRDPGEPLDGIGQYLYPSRPSAQK
jgi:menaquinol-cytochrome c reductase iron-sulfur subunit